MSTNLYWRPVPNVPEGNRLGDQLKYVIAREVFNHDGSLSSDWISIDKTMLPFLRGVLAVAASGPLYDQTKELIDLIKTHGAVQLSTSS
jgi:hypothetical protein